ncbi:HAMP domain-containing histidine kinase [Marinicauda algicola]|uniref:histidine kinase n=1 Tax=Marinicauda algicola TaxID=2029849 RepID=A0A4S2GZW7_9PROT|nr:HAMP domain-containing sensor histidine kinase [Marinicauda algicola]TGY88548.1 HAMP domain-containing histidine kinase [Marinicauda algicola]
MRQSLRPLLLLDRTAGRLVHALWLGVVAGGAFINQGEQGVSAGGLALWATAALPGFIGLKIAGSRALRLGLNRLILALAWVLPALAATAALGGVLTPAALVFLAGPAALAASGRQLDAGLSWTVNAATFAGFAVFEALAPAGAPGMPLESAPVVMMAGFLAACALVASLRHAARLNAARAEARRLRPAAEAFAHAPAPLVAVDTAGRVTAASRALRRLVPGAPRELTGLPLTDFAFDEAGAQAVRAGLSDGLEGGGAEASFGFAVRGGRGEETRVQARGALAGQGLVLSLDREDEAQSAEVETLRAERDEALAASRAKSEFLAAVSHELRTPLNAIIGFSDVMKQRLFGPLPARYAEYGDLIHESGIHLLDLIGDVLDMSKIEADRYELVTDRFDARDVVETCAKMMRLRAEDKGLVLSVDAGDHALEVEADRKAVRQILLNLVSNAIKFTPAGGAVAVMARAQGDQLLLAVGDSGVGMAPEEIGSLGARYTQTRSAQGIDERGSGLGLSLVRMLAEMHGGSMNVQSVQGEGTTVTVRLPVLVEARGEVAAFEPLAVHEQIRRAQSAGEMISKAHGAA